MTFIDYLVDSVLVLIVFRQIRESRFDRRAIILPLAIVVSLLLAGCSSRSGPPAAPAMQPYQTGPPDQLIITILPDPIIERSVVVRPDGMISVDLIGDVPASGRSTEEIALDIEKRISRFKRDAKVTVALAESRSSQITVLGEVAHPSTFALTRDTRVIEALGHVGGPSMFAAKRPPFTKPIC